ncbi:MAG: hypothetical protein QG657_1756 [Acidobacteriota bacterium]|nr:hypothetical protein [Acidobacteriota bacterium]
MKISLKIILLDLGLTLGSLVNDMSLYALREDCYCLNDTEAEMDCLWICASYDGDCFCVYPVNSGCEYGDCDTLWRFYCESGLRGYLYTTAPNCSDCDWIW